MHAKHLRVTLALVLLAVVGLLGCDGSTDIGSANFDPAQVEAAALTVAQTLPEIDVAEQSIFGMVDQIVGVPAPLTSLDPVGMPTHTEAFQLENGLSGTVDASIAGEFSFSFGGTVPVEGGSVTIQGSMVVSLAASQPASGASYQIAYEVTASGPEGNASWSATGTLTVGGTGQLSDYDLTMTHSVAASSGATAMVTTHATPTGYEITATGPFANTTRFVVDRTSMTGSIYVNGNNVANLSVSGDCVDIDYVSEEYTDVSVCPQTA